MGHTRINTQVRRASQGLLLCRDWNVASGADCAVVKVSRNRFIAHRNGGVGAECVVTFKAG